MSIRISHRKFPVYCNHCNAETAIIHQANDKYNWEFYCWQCGLRHQRQRPGPELAWQDVFVKGGFGVTYLQFKASGQKPMMIINDITAKAQRAETILELTRHCEADDNIECAYYTLADEHGRFQVHYVVGNKANDQSMLRQALQKIAEEQIESQLRRSENVPFINWDLLKYGRKAG